MARQTVATLSADVAALRADMAALVAVIKSQHETSAPRVAQPLPEAEPDKPKKQRRVTTSTPEMFAPTAHVPSGYADDETPYTAGRYAGKIRRYYGDGGEFGRCMGYAGAETHAPKPHRCKADAVDASGLCETHKRQARHDAGATHDATTTIRAATTVETATANGNRVPASQPATNAKRHNVAGSVVDNVATRNREANTPTCSGIVKSTGKPCQSHILIGDTGLCIAHQSQAGKRSRTVKVKAAAPAQAVNVTTTAKTYAPEVLAAAMIAAAEGNSIAIATLRAAGIDV